MGPKALMSRSINSTKQILESFRSKIDDDRVLDEKMKLEDINTDCQLLILEKLDLPSLVKMAELNKKYSILAADVFKRKFGKLILNLKLSVDFLKTKFA